MRRVIYKHLFVLLVGMLGLLYMTPAFAQESQQLAQITISPNLGLSDVAQKSQTGEGENLQTRIGSDSIPQIIGDVIGVGLAFLGTVFFVLTLYAGFLWMLAHGNDQYTKKAKDILSASLIGLIIVLGSYAIVNFIFSSVESTAGNPTGNPNGGGVCDPKYSVIFAGDPWKYECLADGKAQGCKIENGAARIGEIFEIAGNAPLEQACQN